MTLEIQERGEARSGLVCAPDLLPFKIENYEVQKFAERYSNTLYFALENGTFPEGFALRARIYSEQAVGSQEFSILDTSLPCFLEIKLPVENNPGARKKLRFQTTVKEAIEIAQSFEKISEIFAADLTETMINKLRSFYEAGASVVPQVGVSYERTHFNNGHRITLDQNISSFALVLYDGQYFVKSTETIPYSMLEMKTERVTAEAKTSKFQIAKKSVAALVHIEPGMEMRAEGDWMLLERELKIDTIGEAQTVLGTLESNEEISLGPWKKGSSLMQFIILGENGICIMGREGVTKKMAIKNKENVESTDGVITRTERVQPYSQEALNEIVLSKGGDPEHLERSAYFTRNRMIRLVTCRSTGNIFAITADRCVSEDGRADLDQTEIEYRGKITTQDNQRINQQEVDEDFQKVARWLYREFKNKKLVPQLSSVTKYNWAAARNDSHALPEGMKQGCNARMEIDPQSSTLIKYYDLWGTVDSEAVVENYQNFRAAVSQIYKIPELKRMTREATALKIEEAFVEGIRADKVLAEGTEQQVIDFIHSVILPLAGQINFGQELDLGEDRISRCPLITPVDIKPDNFVITPQGESVFVDMYPPLNRDEVGLVVETYQGKDQLGDSWDYGEAALLITRFLIRCIIANPQKAELMTKTLLEDVKKIDRDGFLLEQMKINTAREKTVERVAKIEKGIFCLGLINTA